MVEKKSMKRIRFITILLVLSIIMNVVLFFYGLINNIAMQKERAISVELKVQAEKSRLESVQAQQELQTALEEARKAKDYALAQAMLAAKEAAQNKK